MCCLAAGGADLPGEVVVQTLHADEPAIQYASEHDYDGFAAWELPLRQEARLPPFSRMVRFIVRHEKHERAREGAAALHEALRSLLPAGTIMWGPSEAGVLRIRGHFRHQVLVISAHAGLVQKAIAGRMEAVTRDIHAEVVADVDPMNLL